VSRICSLPGSCRAPGRHRDELLQRRSTAEGYHLVT
jgi:hypothetical protein